MSKPFRSDKRKKELLRLKKQEEKRQRRFGAKQNTDEGAEGEEITSEITETEGAETREDAEGEETTKDTAVADEGPTRS